MSASWSSRTLTRYAAIGPAAPVGVYCAGLGQKRPRDPITVASIQSVYKKAAALGWRGLLFIDECHLLSPESDTMYRRLIRELKEINPKLKVVGFTATPYRLKTGMLTEGKDRIFTDIACEVSMRELLDAGHICPLVGKSSAIRADESKIRITAGEYNSADQERAFDIPELVNAAVDEIFILGAARRKWLVFASGIRHGEHIRDAIRLRGRSCEMVHGGLPKEERDRILTAFKSGPLESVVNYGVLTTGFDAPNIDLLALLRMTTSPGLYTQILGRGMRTHPDKRDCLVLDYAGNVERFGPVTDIRPPSVARKRQSAGDPNAPACRVCPECRLAGPLTAIACGECGLIFPPRERGIHHDSLATELEVMRLTREIEQAAPRWVDVDAVRYFEHTKPGKIPSLRVEYRVGLSRYSEWVCVQHPPGSFPRIKAETWWLRRGGERPPHAVAAALPLTHALTEPSRIAVRKNGAFWEIADYDFTPRSIPQSGDSGRAAVATEPSGFPAGR